MGAAKRSRTGCATCRTRKLKCDEAKPICGQCEKSKKPCVASEGIAFRHEQNAGINTDLMGSRSLEGFFKDRFLYSEEQKKNFVPLPSHLEWRYVTDVYAEDLEHQNTPRNAASPQAYQREMASGGLEALSTAAAENQSYQPPVTYADINNLYQGPNSGYGPVSGPNQNHNIKFLLNPSNTPAAMIDPNLDTTALENVTRAAERSINDGNGSTHGTDHKLDEEAHQDVAHEEHNLLLLKHYDEQAI